MEYNTIKLILHKYSVPPSPATVDLAPSPNALGTLPEIEIEHRMAQCIEPVVISPCISRGLSRDPFMIFSTKEISFSIRGRTNPCPGHGHDLLDWTHDTRVSHRENDLFLFKLCSISDSPGPSMRTDAPCSRVTP